MRFNMSKYQPGDPLEVLINNEKAVFKFIPQGTFVMGSPDDEDDRRDNETQHKVLISKPFFMLETPITQALWKAVKDALPESLKDLYFINDSYPIIEVTWYDCAEYISMLNENDFAPKGLKFDFPTESEWEYACRAGTTSPYHCGKNITSKNANIDHGFDQRPSRVKQYNNPNDWGLHDMHGNVWEWCSDWYAPYPESSNEEPIVDPKGPEAPVIGHEKVTRGGGSHAIPSRVRSAKRYHSPANSKKDDIGFRLVLREREA